MKNEYAIINLSDYRQKLEELREFVGTRKPTEAEYAKMQIYSTLIAESTPLIPVIEKAFDDGFHKGYNVGHKDAESHPLALTISHHIHNDRESHINNLKLDI